MRRNGCAKIRRAWSVVSGVPAARRRHGEGTIDRTVSVSMAPVRERDRAASSGERRIALLALAAAILLGCAGPPPSTRGEAAQPFIRVGPNVRVSTAHSTDTHYEVVVAAHPHDSSRLIIGSIIYPESAATYGTVVYHSRDGGASWTQTLGLPALDRTGDPAMAFGPDGVAYYVASSLPAVGERRLKLFRSTDGGGMWDGPHPLTYMDREYVTVDATAGRNRGRVYVNGNNRVPRTVSDFVVFTSTDGGRVFSGPGTRSAFGSVHATVMGNAVVVSDGTLVGVYVEASPRAGIHAPGPRMAAHRSRRAHGSTTTSPAESERARSSATPTRSRRSRSTRAAAGSPTGYTSSGPTADRGTARSCSHHRWTAAERGRRGARSTTTPRPISPTSSCRRSR